MVTTVRRLSSQGTALDSTRYAVLPFAYDSGVATLNERAALRDALASRWSGITLVEEFREAELLQAHAAKTWTMSDAYQACPHPRRRSIRSWHGDPHGRLVADPRGPL